MDIRVFATGALLGAGAARRAGEILRAAIAARGVGRLVAATGASQFDFLDALVAAPDLDWRAVEMFHLDEYVGLPDSHPASFRRYLRERLVRRTGITRTHWLDGDGELEVVVADAARAVAAAPVDVAFVGIGENGHLAFNDPPADFRTEAPYLLVELDEACRRQQVGEGWFARLEDVPRRAISMSVRQILGAQEILCIVPDERKAAAVAATLTGEVRPEVPASILRTHPRVTLFLDHGSASRLDRRLLEEQG